MRVTDARYARERAQMELAMQMIALEARTCTIRSCTGLSEDRIRKIYTNYFRVQGRSVIRRQRGKSPTQTAIYVKTSLHQCEATTLAALMLLYEAIGIAADYRTLRCRNRSAVAFGHRICLAYEAYRAVHPSPRFSFERAWALLQALVRGDELAFRRCNVCDSLFVHDTLSAARLICPCCKLKGVPSAPRRRRSGGTLRRQTAQTHR